MKRSLKKGGVGDVVTLIIIIGLALALVVAVVVPSIKKAQGTGQDAYTNQKGIDTAISSLSTVS